MNPFEKRRLGRTEACVTRLGLGCGTLGDPWEIIPDEQAHATVEAAYAAGITYFDTAPWYGIGQSEHRTGAALRRKPRETFFLSTKVGRILRRPAVRGAAPYQQRWKGGLPFDLKFDYTRDGVLRSLEDSLQRLGIASVDALVIHDLDHKFHGTGEGVRQKLDELDGGGGMAALEALKSTGEIKAVGAGINQPGMIPRFLERFELDFFLVAVPYTLLDQDALEEELPLCIGRGVSVVIGAPFASGVLAAGPDGGAPYAYRPATSQVIGKTRRIESVCRRYDVPLPAAALQFPLAHTAVAAIIPGPNSPEQVRANMEHMRRTIPEQLWEELRREGLIHPEAPTPR